MHIEKNVGESIIATLLEVPGKMKDGNNARQDLVPLGLRPELQPKTAADGTKILASSTCTLIKLEKDKFLAILKDLRVPAGYCSNFSSLVNVKERKLIGLESYDYHMLMQQFLPIAIKGIMAKPVCLCGPVCFRWMYPFERCMLVIKGHVRNRNKPEGCIAEKTIGEETIEFLSEYKAMVTVGIPPDKHNTIEYEDGKPLSVGTDCEVDPELHTKAHMVILENSNLWGRISGDTTQF